MLIESVACSFYYRVKIVLLKCMLQYLVIGECQNYFSKIYMHLLTERDIHSPNLTLSSAMGVCTMPHSYQLVN